MSVPVVRRPPPALMRFVGALRPVDVVGKRRASTALLLAAWLGSSVWVATRLDQGWVPHDDGAFAQSAQRVLDGQLPHRDFTDLYTGGLTFLNAAVFWLFGENLIWLRVPLFVVFLAFVPCVYYLARRFVPPPVALLTALVAVAWGLPIYPAAVPSWYLLFFAVLGAAAIVRHLDTGNVRWLVVAGLLGGLSISFKIVGVYYVLAVLLALVFIEQESRRGHRGGWLPRTSDLFVTALAPLSLGSVIALLRPHLGAPELVNFVLPLAALCSVVVVNEARTAGTLGARERLGAYLRRSAPFAVGAVVPVAVLAAPYVALGAVDDLVMGVFDSPRSRLDSAYSQTPGPLYLVWALPIVAAFVARRRAEGRWRKRIDVATATLVGVMLVTASGIVGYYFFWFSGRELAPFVLTLGAVALVALPSSVNGRLDRRALFLVLALTGFVSLVQFPFGAPVYFTYVAPLLAVAAVGTVKYADAARGVLPVAILAAYMLFGLTILDRGSLYTLGREPARDDQTALLDGARASIRVSPSSRREYARALRLLEQHGAGRFAYAGPDTPELYFLSGFENPTRSLFDFLDGSGSAVGEHLLRTLRERSVSAIVINLRPSFSDPLDAATLSALRERYPHHERTRRFDIRWAGPRLGDGPRQQTTT